MKKLAVLVSIYESGDWLEARLRNLKECKRPNMEVWCINANSPDPRDHEIPQRYGFKYLKLEERVSVYAVWNMIINKSQSDYIATANTDDLVSPTCYNELSRVLDNGADFAYPSWYVTSRPGQSWETLTDVDPNGKPGVYYGDLSKGGVGHFPMWRRSLHDKLGLFDESFKALADADWWARAYYVGRAKFRWVNKPMACYAYRNGENLWHREINPDEWDRYHKKVERYKQGQL